MKNINRFIVFSKRILSRKIYLCMLTAIIAITAVYKLLPAKSSSADIKVALCSMDNSEYTSELFNMLADENSVYTFYVAEDEDAVIRDVKSGYAECGYVIPENFFADYITGTAHDNQIHMYVIPSTTLGSTICESIFSCIFELCAEEILVYGVDIPEYNEELTDRIQSYMNSEDIFRISDTTSGELLYDSMVYHITPPVFEISLILIIFSGLLGLLIYIQDAERGIYISQSSRETAAIRGLSIITAILPMLAVSIAAAIITTGISVQTVHIIIAGIITFAVSMILGLIIRKSTLLIKVLPIIMLFCIMAIFISVLI